jgi:hypothetical protein
VNEWTNIEIHSPRWNRLVVSKLIELKGDQSLVGNRRWFSSREIDLVIWTDKINSIVAFEFYYDKNVNEHVLIWRESSGFTHLAVDDGERKPALEYKQTPILVIDGCFDPDRIRNLFEGSCEDLPADVAHCVRLQLEKLTTDPYTA